MLECALINPPNSFQAYVKREKEKFMHLKMMATIKTYKN